MNPVKVLFLSANPTGTGRLALDEEVRDIEIKLRAAEYRNIELLSKWAVRPDDLLQYFNQYQAHIVHFSGHGSPSDEIILVGNDGKAKSVDKVALANLFRVFNRNSNIRVVVLNACYSRAQGQAIIQHVDCAIGINKAIADQAARIFAASFYRAIGFRKSVQEAFDQGVLALQFEGISEDLTPELLVRTGVVPSQIFLGPPDTPSPVFSKTEAKIQQHLQELKEEIQYSIEIDRQIHLSLLNSPSAVKRISNRITVSSIGSKQQHNRFSSAETKPPFATLAETFSELKNRVLVLGAPGAGKTTTLLQFADDSIDARVGNLSSPIPLWFSLHQWDFREPLLDWMKGQYKSLFSAIGSDEHSLLYIFDGLDELGEKIPDQPDIPENLRGINARQHVLETIAEQLREAQVVLSCREHDYEQIGEKAMLQGAVTLLPLSDLQIESYLQDRDQIALWNNLLKDENLLELARTPLLLTLLSISSTETNPNILTGFEDESWTANRIFDLYIQRRFQHEALKQTLPFDEGTTRQHLSQIAGFMWRDWWSPKVAIDFETAKSRIGNRETDFMSFAKDMHFVRQSSSGQIEFIHLKFRDYCAIPNLEKVLTDEMLESDARRSAAYALGEIRDTRAISVLGSALTNERLSLSVRGYAAEVLGKIGDARAISVLEKALTDETLGITVRLSTVWALGKIEDTRAISILGNALTNEKLLLSVRGRAAEVLGNIGNAGAISVLEKALTDQTLDNDALGYVIKALGNIGDARVIPAMEKVLADEMLASYVRRYAVKALGKIGDAKAIPALEKAVTDQNTNVRWAATIVLKKLRSHI
ncbi:hypothetical protein IAD21_00725 [Abditibacteriota bacterium]|nr:hypothetical protein IAD21_00725 [Abditibacteriota bacterium]